MSVASETVRDVRSAKKTSPTSLNKTSSSRVRTIKPPAKPGTIKRSVIKKAIREIMAEN